MALIDQVDVINCGIGDLLGTGMQGCSFDWDRIETIELSSKNYQYLEEQTLVSVREAQQKGDLIILQGIKSFNLSAVDPNISTADGSGYETVTGELPYKYNVMFDNNGVNFWKALRKLNSKDQYNVAFYDVEGNKIFTQSKSGVIKGFSIKMMFTGQYKGKEGNNPAESSMTIQLADYSELERQSFIAGDNLDFSAKSDLEGVNDFKLTASPVASASTSITVTALLLDKSHFVDGLLVTDFLVKKNGVVIVPSAIVADASAKTYKFTVPAVASAEVYTVSSWDADLLVPIIQSTSGLLFKSDIASVIVS
jgi:hypothetical protein